MIGPRDPDRDIDDLLEDGGGEIGNLYRRLPRYEPPRRLDRAILGEAARAVHSGKPPRRQRWIVGVGSAAGLVLAAGIAWRIGNDAMHSPPIAPTESAPVMAPRVVPVEPITESARTRRDEPAPASSPMDSAAPAAPPPPSAATGAVSKRAANEVDKARKLVELKAAPKPAPAQEPPPPPPAPQATRQAEAPAAFPADAKEEQAKDKAASAERETGAAADGLFRHRAQQPAAGGALPQSTPSSSVELRRDMQLAPEDWLAHIHQLIRQGRRQQAAESLRLFMRTHPDWEISDDLRELQR